MRASGERIRWWMAPALVLVLMLATACGGGEGPTPNPGDDGSMDGGSQTEGVDENGVVVRMDGESEDDYIARLYEAAQEEGEIVYYHSANAVEIENILANWEKAFPEVEFVEIQATSGTILERALTECRAGQVRADVYGGGSGDQAPLADAGCLVEYRPVNERNIDPNFVISGEPYVPVGYLTFQLAFNPDLISADEVPDTWEGVLDPRFKGEIGAQLSGFEWYCGIKKYMGEEAGVEFLNRLAEQNVRIVDGGTLSAELLSAGEYSIFLDLYSHNLERYQNDGLVVDIKVPHPDPIPAVTDMASVQKDAPNPNAARLVMEFFLTPEGQDVFLSRGKATVLQESVAEHPFGHLLEGAEIEMMGAKDVDFDQCAREWNDALVRR